MDSGPVEQSSPKAIVPVRRRIGHLAGLGAFLLLVGLWLAHTFTHPELLARDWVAFDRAGWRALGGGWAEVYAGSAAERWPYLYPPFALPLALPLGLLPFWPSYVAAVAMGLAGLVWSCRRLGAVVGRAEGRTVLFCSTLLCAPTTVGMIITGQYSWLYFMALLGTVGYAHRGDERSAGRALALLAIKPNLALVVVPLLVLRRRWTLLRHAAVTVTAAVVVTLPLTFAAWPRFVDAVRAVAARQESGEAPFDKQITVLAFLRVVTGRFDGTVVVWSVWLLVAAGLGLLTAWAWYRADAEVPLLRLMGIAGLAMVALSPRLYFYDGLVAAVAAAAWYLEPGRYRLRLIRRAEGVCLAGIGTVTFLFFPWPAVGTAFGPFAALWLALECVDVLAGVRHRAATTSLYAPPAPAGPEPLPVPDPPGLPSPPVPDVPVGTVMPVGTAATDGTAVTDGTAAVKPEPAAVPAGPAAAADRRTPVV